MVLERRQLLSLLVARARGTIQSGPAQPVTDSRPGLHQERRQNHQHHGHRDERLLADHPKTSRRQTDGRSGTLEHERRLADLRQRKSREGGDTNGISKRHHHAGRDHDLQDEHARRHAEHKDDVIEQETQIQQHADRHEENGVEDRPQRKDLREGVAAELTLADDETRKKRPQGESDAKEARQPGRAETDRNHDQQKQLFPAGLGELLEEKRDQPACQQEHDCDDQQCLAEYGREINQRAALAYECRNEQHHHDHGQILEDEEPHRHLPGGRVRLRPFAE